MPATRKRTRHIKQVATALKAPKTNDSNAKVQAKHVEGLIRILNTAIQQLDGSAIPDADLHREVAVELHQLQTHLSKTHTELQALWTPSYTIKLASQAEIQERILQLKEALSQTITDLTLRLLVVVLTSGAQAQLSIVQRINSAAHEHDGLVRDHNALYVVPRGVNASRRNVCRV
ncbi:unnamed protein product [Rhizoctonia solani]|uniref:Uncharacterized protein n=1 Tax=Rhizoctonia solani TaxID=456999 RepID=A0A8H2X5Y2_9AGAM|nr:unnamed protein product [Rhizoctonia solani]